MRCTRRFLSLLIPGILTLVVQSVIAKDVSTLEINAPAPELGLPGVDGKTYQLDDFADSKLLVLIFTCNHCPTAQAYEQRCSTAASSPGHRNSFPADRWLWIWMEWSKRKSEE